MPADKQMKSLLQASEAAYHNTSQHILLSVSADGRIHASGTNKLVTGLVSDVDLYKKVKACLGSNVAEAEENVGYATTYSLAYTPLPCSVSSAEWKKLGSAAIRGILRNMLDCAGYGRSKGDKKLGEGAAPVGRPANIDWSKFKGSTRSGLKIDEVTSIIISMLQAGGFSAETHVEPANPDSINSDDDAAAEQIIEEFVVDVLQAQDAKEDGESTKRKDCSGGLKRKFGSV